MILVTDQPTVSVRGVTLVSVSAIVTIAQATCQVANEASSDPAWVNFTCSVVDATGTPRTILVKVPTAQVPAFVAANPPPVTGGSPDAGSTLRR